MSSVGPLYLGILVTCYLIFFNRWKRSVEDFSETWSLDLGLRILAVKEVSCKRRLVSISTTNIFTLQTLRKWPQPLSGVWFAFFDTLLSHLASRPNPPDYIQAKHKPIQVITLLNEEFFQIQSNQHCSSTVCTVGCFTCDTLQKLKIPNPARNC